MKNENKFNVNLKLIQTFILNKQVVAASEREAMMKVLQIAEKSEWKTKRELKATSK